MIDRVIANLMSKGTKQDNSFEKIGGHGGPKHVDLEVGKQICKFATS